MHLYLDIFFVSTLSAMLLISSHIYINDVLSSNLPDAGHDKNADRLASFRENKENTGFHKDSRLYLYQLAVCCKSCETMLSY
ncbi:hypothetical protein J1TS3_24800 [Siminovitchia fordii]|uniref:Uncharacterized protein n=1 Tax=Siminovitchia fordii TaxID=254759 RepID=A0ABQ4K6I6_9BACI|nr:hypothetical protein J1TS3_24800 [Siminovitchia fordii]